MFYNFSSSFLRLILHIVDEANSTLESYTQFPGKAKLENCVLYCLNIVERTIAQQDLFFDAHFAANSSILLAGINKLLLGVNYRSGKPDHMLNIVKYVTYNSWLPQHALIAVKILTHVARQPGVSALLLSEFTRSPKLTNEIRHGFVECLESDVPITPSSDDEAENNSSDYIELTIKEEIIKLLAECLPQSAPNLAHYLLGFDITKDIRLTQMQQPGVLDFPSNCTKSLVTILDEGIGQLKSGMDIPFGQQRLLQNAYRLLYALCSNQKTSEVVLRFLRACNEFLLRHISALPFKNVDNPCVLNQMTGLLKCVAIELKITAGHSQVKQFKNLSDILLGAVNPDAQSGDGGSPNVSHYYSIVGNNSTFLRGTGGDTLLLGHNSVGNNPRRTNDAGEHSTGLLICKLLECLDFDIKPIERPKWDFFDNSQMDQLFKVKANNKTGSLLESIPNLIHNNVFISRIALCHRVLCHRQVQS